MFIETVLGDSKDELLDRDFESEKRIMVKNFFDTKIVSLLKQLSKLSNEMKINKDNHASYDVKKKNNEEWLEVKNKIGYLVSSGYQTELGMVKNDEVCGMLWLLINDWFEQTGNENQW